MIMNRFMGSVLLITSLTLSQIKSVNATSDYSCADNDELQSMLTEVITRLTFHKQIVSDTNDILMETMHSPGFDSFSAAEKKDIRDLRNDMVAARKDTQRAINQFSRANQGATDLNNLLNCN